MTSISRRRRLVALLLLPFMMVLAGCGKFHADFDIQDADTINVSMDLGIDSSLMATSYSSAEEMCADLESDTAADELAPTVEPYESDGMYGCKISGMITSDDFGTGLDLVEENGEYHFTLDTSEAGMGDLADPSLQDYGFEFSMAFTFPGKIIESSGGQIDGSTVTFTDVTEISNGVDIRAEANSFPWVIVIVAVLVVGFLLLLVLAAVIFFVVRSRRNKAAAPAGVPGGYGAAASQAPQAPQQDGQQWGQTSSPAAPQAPQQDGQQWGQASPPAAPQPPQAPQPGGQQWDGQGQQQPPWAHPDGPQQPGGQQPGGPQQPGGQQGPGSPQPPQQPGW
jgi:hypothetical protein